MAWASGRRHPGQSEPLRLEEISDWPPTMAASSWGSSPPMGDASRISMESRCFQAEAGGRSWFSVVRTPAFGERSHVHGVVAEQREQFGGVLLCARVVAGDRQGGAIGRARGPRQVPEVLVVDVVERLHGVRPDQVPLEQFAVGELPRL